MTKQEIQFIQDDTDNKQRREIARDLTIALLEKSGVQAVGADKTQLTQIADAAIEMTRKITEAFKVRR